MDDTMVMDGTPVRSLDGRAEVGTPVELPGSPRVLLLPVTRAGRRERLLGAYVMSGDGVRFAPVLDLDRLLAGCLAATTAITAVVALAVAARRPSPAVRTVTMGPGGWVSFKGVPGPPLRPAARRPWWARALRAHRLVVEGGPARPAR